MLSIPEAKWAAWRESRAGCARVCCLEPRMSGACVSTLAIAKTSAEPRKCTTLFAVFRAAIRWLCVDARVHRRQRLHELPGDGARQQEAAVQVHLCLVRRYPTYIRSRRLRQLLVPDFPCVTLRCGDVNDYDDGEADVTFWRRMRYALTCDTEQERCRRNVEVISLLVPCQKHTEDSH